MMHLFVQKCLRTVSEGSDLRQTLLFYERILCHQLPGQPLPFTMSQMESDLCQHDNTLSKGKSHKSSFRQNGHNGRHHQSHRDLGKRSSANSAKKYQKPLKCLKCGGNHKLMQCRKATDQERKDLWEAYKKTWTTNCNTKTSNPTRQANHTQQQASPKPPSTASTAEDTMTDHQANAVIPSQNSQKKTLHWATMAGTQEKRSKCSELSEWLIDSGCSNHMTPFEDDLITDIGPSKSLVEVSNGNIVKAP